MEHTRIRILQRENVKLRRQRAYLLIFMFLFIISLAFNAYLVMQLEKIQKESEKLVQAVDEYIVTVEKYKQVTRGNYIRPKIVQAVETEQHMKLEPITFEITGYCSCTKCCGKTDGITKSGVKAKSNKTIAMDKKYPMGTEVIIEGFENIVFEKQDIGGAIKGNKIDIYFDTHQEALNFGRQTKKVWILTPEALRLAQLNN